MVAQRRIPASAPLVRHGAEKSRLAPRADQGDLRSMKIAGRRYACDWCGGQFHARRANQRFCGAECSSRFRSFCAAHGPALVPMLLDYVAGRYRKRGSPEHTAAMQAWGELLRRARELRDRKSAETGKE